MLRFLIATLVPLAVWVCPTDVIPLADLTVIEHRVLAVFTFAVLYWILEPIPIYATSVLIAVLLLLTASNGGIKALVAVPAEDPAALAALGNVLSYKALMHSFAEPIIMLFIGGFFLAMAATKYQVDNNVARVLLKPFGTRPSTVLLGLMIVTAIFSMFMSNTATTAMMLAVLTPILAALPAGDAGRTGLILGVPMAANIGGIGTPIGTPPNAVAMKYLTGGDAISFAGWMVFAVPFVVVLLMVAWALLGRIYKPQAEKLEVEIDSRWRTDREAIIVYVVFVLTILLWLTGPLHGIKSHVVAMVPVAVFSATGIINAQDLKRLSWDVIWLVAGGFALGTALKGSGLSNTLIEAVPFASLPIPVLLVVVGVVTALMATFMSNTATANLLLPILAALAGSLTGLESFGGAPGLILCCALAASMGMALPVSTPPNAMAHASGMCTTRQMAVIGSLIAVVGLGLIYALLAALVGVGFFA